jgi:hypothetical protein
MELVYRGGEVVPDLVFEGLEIMAAELSKKGLIAAGINPDIG